MQKIIDLLWELAKELQVTRATCNATQVAALERMSKDVSTMWADARVIALELSKR